METIKSLQNIALFVKVAETGSFSQAAKIQGVSKSQVSKALKSLEEELGTILLNRSTRQVHLTPRGQKYYERCRAALQVIHEGKQEIMAEAKEPRGLLRVTMAGVFSEKFVAPCLLQLARKYPRLEIEAHFDSQIVNILESKYDVAIRIGNLPDSSLYSKRLAQREEVFVASVSYLKSRPIENINDLASANCLSSESTWTLYSGHRAFKVDMRGNFRSNNPRVTVEAVKQGLGVAKLPLAYVAEDIKKGKLQRVLPEYAEPSKDIWFITPHKLKFNHNAELLYRELVGYLKSRREQGSVF